ncbi:MAG: HNH endonuclease signature motif containing protein [Candidatus Bipolaricaulis sp.]|nr:HNH endonuclease signature motif containing protein [Candidatus Bipolaricaulis sp.]
MEEPIIKSNPNTRGEKNNRWNGGVSEYPNHYRMKLARLEKLKMSGGLCEVCGQPAREIHHIDESKGNHSIENLAILCKKCHVILHSKDRDSVGDHTVRGFDRIPFRGVAIVETALHGKLGIERASELLGISGPTFKKWFKEEEKKPLLMEALENPDLAEQIIGKIKWRRNKS